MERLSNIIKHTIDNRGKNPPYYSKQGIPVIDTFLIGKGRYPDENSVKRYIDEYLYENFIRSKNKKDDLLVTLVGNGCGNSCLCNSGQIIIQNAVGFRFKENIDNLYIYYYFQQNFVKEWIKNLDRGSAQPNIKVSDLVRMKLNLPNLQLQKKISNVLNIYDKLVENNKKRIELLEKKSELLFKEWFIRFRFPANISIEYENSNIGKIPRGFKIINIKDIIDYHIGGGWGEEEYSSEYTIGAYVIRGTDFHLISKSNISSCPYRFHKTSNYNSRKLIENDIILEISGGTDEQPVGRTVIITEGILKQTKEKVICASFCKLLRPNYRKITPNYLYHWLQFLYKSKMIEQYQVQSTGIINFKFDYFLKKGPVLLPPLELMRQFEIIIQPIRKEIENLALQNVLLEKQRDLLLPRLMSGKLSVEGKEVI